jgi:hypothetical protein
MDLNYDATVNSRVGRGETLRGVFDRPETQITAFFFAWESMFMRWKRFQITPGEIPVASR